MKKIRGCFIMIMLAVVLFALEGKANELQADAVSAALLTSEADIIENEKQNDANISEVFDSGMKKILSILSTVDLGQIKNTIIEGIVVAYFTSVFTVTRMKKGRLLDYQAQVYNKRMEIIWEIREFLKKSLEYEEDLEETDEQRMSTSIDCDTMKFPSFMRDRESLLEHALKISDMRKKYEVYLDLRSAACLYIMEKYLRKLLEVVGTGLSEKDLNLIGGILIVDICKWAKAFDTVLVRMLNKPKYKLYAQRGWQWTIQIRCAEVEFFYCSYLYRYMVLYKKISKS